MKKEQIQKEIIEVENKLKELRDKLNEAEQPKRYAGLVYKTGTGELILCPEKGNGVNLHYFGQWQNGVDNEYNECETFLGHFKNVFIQRSEVENEYVSKADLSEFLKNNYSKSASGVRVSLSNKFNIHY